jgi:hypothetical protein
MAIDEPVDSHSMTTAVPKLSFYGATPVKATSAPHELLAYLDSLRQMGARTAKGEFVASDGTRVPYDIAFERVEKRKGTDG